jgi:hypothetical protein
MDNKASHDVKTFIYNENSRLQYTPPDIHRTNPAEWEICTGKNHFLSGIAGISKPFPITNWCYLANQTDFSYVRAIKILLSWLSRHSDGPTLLMQHQWIF